MSPISEPIEGNISADRLTFRSARIPRELLKEPNALIGSLLRITRETPAPSRDTHPSRSRSERSSVIEHIQDQGEELILEFSPASGPPGIALGARPDEMLTLQIIPSPFVSPNALQEVERFETFLRSRSAQAVGGVLGPPDFLATTNYIVRGRMEESRRIPEDVEETRLLWGHYSWIRGPERLRESVSPDFQHGLVTIFLNDANYVDTGHLLEEIRGYEREYLAGAGLRIDFGGDVAISQNLIDSIVSTQVRSLLLSLIGIFVILASRHRSIFWAFLGMLPSAIALAANFACMGWFGLPLGVATSMFAAMTLGLGVEYSIHLIERFRSSIRSGSSRLGALQEAMQVAGPAMLVDALTVSLGFGILLLSQVPANARLGAMTVVTVIACFLTTLVVMPALMALEPWRSPD
jgi:predicted RND superfamily exporter protein